MVARRDPSQQAAGRRPAKRSDLLLGGSIVFAALIVAGAVLLRSSAPTESLQSSLNLIETPKADRPTIEILTAASVAPRGTSARDIPLRRVKFLPESVPSGALLTLAELPPAAKLTVDLAAGDVLFARQFTAENAHAPESPSTMIPKGSRVITIKIDQPTMADSLIAPQSVVDVVLTQATGSMVIGEAVTVLKIEKTSTSANVVVALLVDQKTALAINAAAPKGRLTLALRGQGDASSWSSKSFAASELSSLEGKPTVTLEAQGAIAMDGSKYVLTSEGWLPAESLPEKFRSVEKTRSAQKVTEEVQGPSPDELQQQSANE